MYVNATESSSITLHSTPDSQYPLCKNDKHDCQSISSSESVSFYTVNFRLIKALEEVGKSIHTLVEVHYRVAIGSISVSYK